HVTGSLDHSAGGGCYRAYRLVGNNLTDLPAQPSSAPDHDFGCANGLGINDADVVVGNIVNPHFQVDRPAFWDANNQLHVLPLLPNASRGWATSVNVMGAIVGVSGNVTSYWEPGHAFLYRGTMQDLNNLCANCFGWELREAAHVNDLGQIVGYG